MEPTPTPVGTPEPTLEPTLEPTPEVTPEPTPEPTLEPTMVPVPTPTPTPDYGYGGTPTDDSEEPVECASGFEMDDDGSCFADEEPLPEPTETVKKPAVTTPGTTPTFDVSYPTDGANLVASGGFRILASNVWSSVPAAALAGLVLLL
ncbi:hypothetical protein CAUPRSCDRAFT_12648 [Caulochytrium protostelioides]|nr:hypothetical protein CAUPRSCDRAFT_12648 [Caulochytrium protostelioides]